jgi:hypothetical protein
MMPSSHDAVAPVDCHRRGVIEPLAVRERDDSVVSEPAVDATVALETGEAQGRCVAGDDDPPVRIDSHVVDPDVPVHREVGSRLAVLSERGVEFAVASEADDPVGVGARPREIDPVTSVDRKRLDPVDEDVLGHLPPVPEGTIHGAARLETGK